ncbi:thiol-disulfide oxidoreductase DCC family protein [Alysiella filiformis]|uniref:Predicted thiol-disulfide oxidoreductase YuxK, DCC family n=1 Tax=Alysiella filiformis DSM 16848 TaxID=1120981 RepID=A0A286E1P5_9NEIS|nr:DUF393 domain-containing protein [Alysiella filiformis]QMT30780.1 DUF393 domain-containing protein [Alysiella filiformis]UBQ56239.1 DUF393 domain-containing protein [Alysiella filiformis DSM 16848]SOD64827.1 Predicted thiol-disulfide oxidoreductase YuxK, DCC family [Alysiella filiformis DSM 16848]
MKHQIFYDAQCPLCAREMALLNESRRAHEYLTIPIQGNEDVLAKHGISVEDSLTYLHAIDADGQILRGMPAVRLVHRGLDDWTIVKITHLPIAKQLADWFYPIFARNRNRFPTWLIGKPKCENGMCNVPYHQRKK